MDWTGCSTYGFYEIGEEEILYWTQWLTHLLKINLEPTGAWCFRDGRCFPMDSERKSEQKDLDH
jgi:hypothetical protein